MAKKVRSQRRKNKNTEDGQSSNSATDDTFAALPEDHTIADSVSTLQSLQDEFEGTVTITITVTVTVTMHVFCFS